MKTKIQSLKIIFPQIIFISKHLNQKEEKMKQSKLVLFIILLLSFLLLGPNSFNQDMKKAAQNAFKEILKSSDKNKDGKLSKAEFMTIWKDKNTGEKNWKTWDTNKDGYVTEEEYVNAVANIQKQSKPQK
jgi:predicted small secreted protein